jgi:hypothetical protein
MGAWFFATDRHPPMSLDSVPVWVCLGSGAILSAVFKRIDGEETGHFYNLDGVRMADVTRWMHRHPDRIPPHPG